jgi:hypothetical protein
MSDAAIDLTEKESGADYLESEADYLASAAREEINKENEIRVYVDTHGNVPVDNVKVAKKSTSQVTMSDLSDVLMEDCIIYHQIMAPIGYVAAHIPQTGDLYKNFCNHGIRPILLQLLQRRKTIDDVKSQISDQFKFFIKNYVNVILHDLSRLLEPAIDDNRFSTIQELLIDTSKKTKSKLEPSDIPGVIKSIKDSSGIIETLVNVLSLLLFDPGKMISGYLITKTEPKFIPKRLSTERILLDEDRSKKSWDIIVKPDSTPLEFGWFGDSNTTNSLFGTSINSSQQNFEINISDLIKTILTVHPDTKLLEIYDSSCAILEKNLKKKLEITDSASVQSIIRNFDMRDGNNKITMSDDDAKEISQFVKDKLRTEEYKDIIRLLKEGFLAIKNLEVLPKTIGSYKPQMITGIKPWLTKVNVDDAVSYKGSLLYQEKLIKFIKEEYKRIFRPVSNSLPTADSDFNFGSVKKTVEAPVEKLVEAPVEKLVKAPVKKLVKAPVEAPKTLGKRSNTIAATAVNPKKVSYLGLFSDKTVDMANKRNLINSDADAGGSRHKRSRRRKHGSKKIRRRDKARKTKKRGHRRTKKRIWK